MREIIQITGAHTPAMATFEDGTERPVILWALVKYSGATRVEGMVADKDGNITIAAQIDGFKGIAS